MAKESAKESANESDSHLTRNFRGLKTAWLESGPEDAPILLLLHGFPDGPQVWNFQSEHFENRFRVIRPYTRGLYPYEGAASLNRYSLDSLSLDCLALLRELDPTQKKPIYCVGHDLGAALAWNLAPLLGNRLSGMVIINGLSVAQMFGRFANMRQQLKSFYIYLMQLPWLPEAIVRTLPRTFLHFAYGRGELPNELRPKAVHAGRGIARVVNQYRAFTRELPKLLRRAPEKVRVPVLVLWGCRDAFLTPPTLDELEPYASSVTLRILDGNHWVFREMPDEVNGILDGFLPAEEYSHEKRA